MRTQKSEAARALVMLNEQSADMTDSTEVDEFSSEMSCQTDMDSSLIDAMETELQ